MATRSSSAAGGCASGRTISSRGGATKACGQSGVAAEQTGQVPVGSAHTDSQRLNVQAFQVRQRRLGGVELVRRAGEADLGHGAAGAIADHDRDGTGLRHRAQALERRLEGEPHGLVDRVAGRDRIGPGQRQRPEVGLERGIQPVAVVLGLPGRIALHPAGGAKARQRLVGDGADVEEGLDRVDEIGEPGVLQPAAAMLDGRRRADDPLQRMEDGEPRPRRRKVGLRRPMAAISEAPARRAVDAALPAQLAAFARGNGGEGDGEAVGSFLDPQVRELRDRRAPAAVADDEGDAADHLHALDADAAQLGTGENGAERTGAEQPLLGHSLSRAVEPQRVRAHPCLPRSIVYGLTPALLHRGAGRPG